MVITLITPRSEGRESDYWTDSRLIPTDYPVWKRLKRDHGIVIALQTLQDTALVSVSSTG
jgi:hypothetical protein